MDESVCQKCNHIRHRQYDKYGNKHGWFCSECQRIKRRNAKIGVFQPKRDLSTCRKCGYNRTQKYVNGRKKGWRCKWCNREYRNLRPTLDRNREHSRRYRLKYPKRHRQAVESWKKKNHTKTASHSLVHRAIKDGRLVKQPCEICGNVDVEAHHDDYSQPLSIRWLCKKHHGEQHETNFED